MRRKINGWKAGVLKGRFLHMRCVAHIVNLVVSDGLKIVNESITRVRQAVRFIKQSPSRLVRFKKCVVEEKINSKKLLCLDVSTRWNSIFLMLDAALVFEYAFERYSEEDPHYVIELNEREGKGCPTSEDWETVRRFSEFLQVFYDLTLRVSGSLHVTSNLFFHELVSVAVLLKDLMTNDDVEMCLMATKMKEKYDKYWDDPEKMNMLIFIAVVLDPRYKLDYVEWMLIEIYDSKHAFVLVNNLKESLNALYEEYHGSSGDVIREEVSSSMDSSQFSPKQKKLQVLKSKYKKHKCEKDGEAKIELDNYLEEETEEECENFDILGWWKFNSARFPTIGRMARDILAVPISTVASESAFNTGGRVLDPFRSSLTLRVVEGLVCAQNWLRSSPFPNIEECLQEVEDLEEDLRNMTIGGQNPDLVELD
ncbi:zinc finger BED domain-containing protein RICESLEEPER 2-like isoform X2 [Chenopodium quinoa]|uniref:zinc finger BED domain-containing protein RICESLEEPER 2-like isoform X2 n=1 Tax=Chenopodium quinoa TaxID=63459 RepID=UPI000B76CDB2|nr:zinc finger BED domain-containing protein RICESLEEPER 2-like isoform X2 [Chenopodium quinoa]